MKTNYKIALTALLVLLATLMSGCAVEKLNVNEMQTSDGVKTRGLIDAEIQVYIADDHGKVPFLRSTRYGRIAFFDGETLEKTILEVGGKYVTSIKPYKIDSKSQFFLVVSGVAEGGVAPAAIHTNAKVKANLYDAEGNLIDKFYGTYSISSTYETLKNAVYNGFAKSVATIFDQIYERKLDVKLNSIASSTTPNEINFSHFDQEKEFVAINLGTGFVINDQGALITAAHVIRNCITISANYAGEEINASLKAEDRERDLAILSLDKKTADYARFAENNQSIKLGQDVITIGYPLAGVLSSKPSLTTGVVSATAGVKDDERFFQITAPVQPGNSGGPLLDNTGLVMGVVSHKLNALAVAKAVGQLPENVSFAVNSDQLKNFLTDNKISFIAEKESKKLSTMDVAEVASKYTVQVSCKGIPFSAVTASEAASLEF